MKPRQIRVEASGTASIAAAGSISQANIVVGDTYSVGAVPLSLATLDYDTILAESQRKPVFARERIISRIQDHVDRAAAANSGKFILIKAQAGLGKTVLAATLITRWHCAHHFACANGGSDPRTALMSIGAQLIERYDLEPEYAPSGLLMSWVGDPARFSRLLADAAERAQSSNAAVLVVIDGLDEAEGTGMAFGLPRILPPGVVIVGTYRDGMPASRLPHGTQIDTMLIAPSDNENIQDIQSFIASQVSEDDIRLKLRDASVEPPEFIRILTKRSEGVWIYLRYVLDEIRSGTRSVTDLDGLPAGLASYYYENIIGRYGRGDGYYAEDLPTLAALAVARQPLGLDQLTRITGIRESAIRRIVNLDYRPFITVRPNEQGFVEYSIFHDSMRDFMNGRYGSELDVVDAQDLATAVRAAHEGIADYYLKMFGGLESGLPALRRNPELARADDRYGLRHLPTHLHSAHRNDDLQQLLTAEHHASPVGYIWADAHDSVGTLDDFLSAISLARDYAESDTDRSLAQNRYVTCFGVEGLYANVAATVVSRSNSIPPSILAALVRCGMWEIERAMVHARQHVDAWYRAWSIASLLKYVEDEKFRAECVRVAFKAISCLKDDTAKARLMERLAPFAGENDHDELSAIFSQFHDSPLLLDMIQQITPSLTGHSAAMAHRHRSRMTSRLLRSALASARCKTRVNQITHLAPYLKGEQLRRANNAALEAVIDLQDDEAKSRCLLALAPRFGTRDLDRALGIAAATMHPWAKCSLLTGLAPYLSARQVGRAAEIALDIGLVDEKVRALHALGKRMTASQLDTVLDAVEHAKIRECSGRVIGSISACMNGSQLARAWQISGEIADDAVRAEAQLKLSYHLGRDAPADVVDRALQSVSEIPELDMRCRKVAGLAGYLRESRRKSWLTLAVELAVSIKNDDRRYYAVTDLMSFFRPGECGIVLSGILDLDIKSRIAVLRRLLDISDEGAVSAALQEAIRTATRIQHGPDRLAALHAVLPILAPDTGDFSPFVDDVLDGLDGVADKSSACFILESLARYMNRQQIDRVLRLLQEMTDGTNRHDVLAFLSERLDAVQSTRAVEIAVMGTDENIFAVGMSLTDFLPNLSEQARVVVMQEALNVAKTLSHDELLAELLASLTHHLTHDLVSSALEAALPLKGGVRWVGVVARLIPKMTEPGRSLLLADALEVTRQNRITLGLVHDLSWLAPYLEKEILSREIDFALYSGMQIPSEESRLSVINRLSPYLDEDQIRMALSLTREITDQSIRISAFALISLRPRCDVVDNETLDEILRSIPLISDSKYKAWLATRLIEHVSGERLRQAVEYAGEAVAKIDDSESKAQALADLAMMLDPPHSSELFSSALDICKAIDDERRRARSLEYVSQRLGPEHLYAAMTVAARLPFMTGPEPHVAILARCSSLAMDMERSDLVKIIRLFYRCSPPWSLLIRGIGAASGAIVQIVGRGKSDALFEDMGLKSLGVLPCQASKV
jgi:hypothetical protein